MNYDDVEGLDDYGRKICDMVKEALAKIGKSDVKWWMERQTAEIPHPRVHIGVGSIDRWFQIDQEELYRSTNDQLREMVERHVRFAFEEREPKKRGS
jgi:hypothetical protein